MWNLCNSHSNGWPTAASVTTYSYMLQSSRTPYMLKVLVLDPTTTKQNQLRLYRNSSIPPTAHHPAFQRSTESTIGMPNPTLPAQAQAAIRPKQVLKKQSTQLTLTKTVQFHNLLKQAYSLPSSLSLFQANICQFFAPR